MSLISIAIVKYSAQNCLTAVVNTELFAYSFNDVKYSYAVKQGEIDSMSFSDSMSSWNKQNGVLPLTMATSR
jgi:uncharacterized protein YhfF